MTVWSLAPPMLALGLAVGTRRVVPALMAGGVCGTVLVAWFEGRSVLAGVVDFVSVGVLGRVSEPSNAQMLVLIALIGGFVHLLEQSGAGRDLIERLTRSVKTPRQTELATWFGGLILFFSDMGNVLILGPMFRPLFDRMGIPRERLAWIIDTTAAPICVLVPFIAWGAYAMGLIEAALPDVDGFTAFVGAMPFQAYALLSLLFVPAMAAFGRPFGPMAAAVPVAPEVEEEAAAGPGASAALVAMGTLLGVLVVTGGVSTWLEGKVTGQIVRTSLATAYLAAIGALATMLWRAGQATGVGRTITRGMGRAAPILVLLVLAWTLAETCKLLGTGDFLAAAIGGALPMALLPVAVFAVGAVTSFATGTSWGTFALLMPLALELAGTLGVPLGPVIGAVLSGGVFGDHCSPISDTTLISSMGAETEHAAHVSTQLPYALTVGACAALTLVAAGLTGSAFSLVVGVAGVAAAVAVSRRSSGSEPRPADSRSSV